MKQPKNGEYLHYPADYQGGVETKVFLVDSQLHYSVYNESFTRSGATGSYSINKGDPCVIINGTIRNDYDQDYYFGYNGTSFDENEIAVNCTIAQLGYGSAALTVHGQSNSGPNPWSSEEQLQELRFANDKDGMTGHASERDAGVNFGVYQGRTNLSDLSTFDSDNYLHFTEGLVWEWSGETVLP